MTSRLWPTTPASVQLTGLLTVQTFYSVAFVPDVDQYLHAVRWYRHSTGLEQRPDGLAVWDAVTHLSVATIGTIADANAVGWQQTNIGDAIKLLAGREYRVGAYFIGGNTRKNAYVVTAPSDPANDLAFASSITWVSQGAYTYPTVSGGTAYFPLMDVVTEDDPPDPLSGEVAGDANNLLASWLISTGDNSHQLDGLPWLSYEALALNQAAIAAAQTALDDLQDKFGTAFGPLGNLAVGALRTQLDTTKAAVDAIKAKIDASLTDTTGVVYTRFDTIDSALAALVVPAAPAAPSAAWTITDTDVETGPAIIPVAADFYNITVTAYGGANAVYSVAGQDLFGFAWWAAPLRGGALGHYQTSRAMSADIYEPGRRMPGLLVSVPPDFEWTWEAWSYVAS